MSQPPSGIDCTGTKPEGRGEALKKGGRGGRGLQNLGLAVPPRSPPGNAWIIPSEGGQINLLED